MVRRSTVKAGRRNAAVMAATAATTAALFLFPTSLPARGGGQVAAVAPGTTVAPALAAGTTTVTGTAAYTRFGPVQVEISVAGGKIVSATAVTYPQSNRRDQEINAYAVPVLEAETLDAQSADVDTVSGATFTSIGYRQSLQAALDAAHL